ncbi:MAG TPA: CHAD domain-containing protein [Nitrososphaera sp.]|nr:CHAD domain-containing protein [Nitrososphaera sp.]
MGTTEEVLKKLRKSQEKVAGRVNSYIANPEDTDNVHDARTSLRKLDAAISLMPKKFRRANSNYVDAYRQFFKANSRIRDCDVIRERIGGPANAPVLKELETRRKSEVSRAIKLARALEAQPLAIRRTSIPDSKTKDRIEKVIRRLEKKVKKLLPEVLADERKVEELHSLRKDCKKLRYALDVLPGDLRKDHESRLVENLEEMDLAVDRRKKPEEVLRELQDLLGDIHDSDITIEYLAKSKASDARRLLPVEKEKRAQLFGKLVEYCNKAPRASAK